MLLLSLEMQKESYQRMFLSFRKIHAQYRLPQNTGTTPNRVEEQLLLHAVTESVQSPRDVLSWCDRSGVHTKAPGVSRLLVRI